jgi:hypothetical protein
MVPRDAQGRGMSAAAVRAMGDIARRHGLESLIAPVRPSWKERYPLVPIERYACWRRPDGWLFDPWMRVHERIGAAVLKPEPLSLRITGTTTEWEDWTGMTFPETGDYWFPGGLATVHIDREHDRGTTGSRTSGCATRCEDTTGRCGTLTRAGVKPITTHLRLASSGSRAPAPVSFEEKRPLI